MMEMKKSYVQDWELSLRTPQRPEGPGRFPKPPVAWLTAASAFKAQRSQVFNPHSINISVQSVSVVTFCCSILGNSFSSKVLLMLKPIAFVSREHHFKWAKQTIEIKITLKSYFLSLCICLIFWCLVHALCILQRDK